ncbi:hypothetical protein V5740_03780 [Croceibacterium sp. TMG7-5b_MA50]|uniref:hypothetical protein n=1 Tax=Croceibacterium sp. TMG7-5b_MA50 TaxID=3121290 RepID=UPI003221F4EC
MRTAILTVLSPPDHGPAGRQVRPLALQQLAFAAAVGCGQVIVLSEREGAETQILTERARTLGLVLRFVRDAHGLLGAVSASEEVLVVAAELLPEAPEIAPLLQRAPAILTLPAGGTVERGFERIDGDHAWAGVALLPGSLVERLADLPPDCDAAAALLRIALQAGARQQALEPRLVLDGTWSLLPGGRARRLSGEAWLRRQLHWRGRQDVTGRAASAIIGRWLDPLLYRGAEASGARALAIVLLGAALLLPLAGAPAWGLAALVPAVLLSDIGDRLRRMAAGPFAPTMPTTRLAPLQEVAVDLALLGGVASAIPGGWMDRLFPPLVLLAALHLPGAMARPWQIGWLGDRLALAAILALGTALSLTQPLTMVLALALLVGDRAVAMRGSAE